MRFVLAGLVLAGALLDGASSGPTANGGSGRAVDGAKSVQLSSYLAGCALGEGESVTLSVAGRTRTFEGRFGLATSWWSRAASLEEERWVTACLLARTNLFGRKVFVAMRGAHPNLRSAAESPDEHTVQEGAFYGNLFAEPPTTYACRGDHPPGSSDALAHRVCAERDGSASRTRCGFVDMGRCSDVCELEASSGYYRRCRGGADVHDEVITVYLARRAE